MRIGIDARFYGTIGKGLGRYASELIAQLERLDSDNEYFIFLRRANWDEYQPKNPRFRKVLAEIPWYGWREQLLYPFWLRRFRLDLMHFPHFNVPILYRRPFVVTVHDLILLRFPTSRATTLGPWLFRLKYWIYRRVIANALRRARQILTVSNYTKDQILKNFPFTAAKPITVTYEACATAFVRPGATAPKIKGVPRPYVLYVGNAYPHKNLERLLAAFAEFRRRGFAGWHLVLVGASDYFYDRLQVEARRADLGENVMFFGQANDAELASLYDSATFYAFPSLCEGFGLPPLEAMCRGLAVASSDASCLPEILGDAAQYFEPNDETKIADALIRLATDETRRRELIAKGRERAKQFDWEACGRLTLDAYRRALADRIKRP